MSPRAIGRYGKSFSYHAPVPPKINLFTSRWSPTNNVCSIDGEGILNACTTKLVPKSARITVTSSDSRYSEIVVWSSRCSTAGRSAPGACFSCETSCSDGAGASAGTSVSSSAILIGPLRFYNRIILRRRFQQRDPRQCAARRSLLRFLLRAAYAVGQALTFHPHLNLKCFLMIRPGLPRHAVFRRGLSPPLQKLLQCGLAIGLGNRLPALQDGLLKQHAMQHVPCAVQPGIQVHCRHHRLERIRQQCLLLAPARLFLTAAQPQMLAQPQSPRRRLQRPRIHQPRATL